MPDDHARFNSDATPQCGQRALQGIDGGLCPSGIVQVALAAEHHIQQRSASLLQYDLLAPVENGAHHRLALIQGLAHTHPLAALPRVHESYFRRRCRLRTTVTLRNRLQPGAQRLGVPESNTRAVSELAAPDARRPRQVREEGRSCPVYGFQVRGALVKPCKVAFRQLSQGIVRLA